ncbi:histidinol-phosphate transaminase [Balneatrix alpica]|uniref:Histidinol-phosphate aminotransferase n=1 Tax=Balneatrix alpica TaxID=75684 RepID=A0ABV5Z6N1_9GAMM|nr:histidinol-phosphate transaminase [Balneatrix alpica]
MSQYWSPIVQSLTPYVPGEQPKHQRLVKLNTNENPYPPSPKAIAAMQAACADSLRLYPDPNSDQLRQVISQYYGLSSDQVFVGNGSDEVLAHIFCGLLKHDKPLLFPDISYSFYPVYCGLYEVEYVQVPLAEDFSVRLADYQQDNGAIILPNPNAPTGIALGLTEIEVLLQQHPHSVVVIDEAYVDFGAQSAVTLIDRYPNLLVVQTLSKSRSLAGLRVGLAMGQAHLMEALERVKNSFNSYPLDRVAQAGAQAAFEDQEYFVECCNKVIATRESLIKALQQCGFEVLPSAANFVFARHPQRDAATLAAGLREQGVIVRHFKQKRIDQFLRISIGTDAECQALLTALQPLLK